MDFEDYEARMFKLWSSIQIVRSTNFRLFTFGETKLPYYVVEHPESAGKLASLRKGMIRITRPSIITPDNFAPEFHHFFDDSEGDGFAQFLMQRSAAFKHLRFDNAGSTSQPVSDSVEEIVNRLTKELDKEEDEETGILTAPHDHGWMALMRYATERVIESTPENVQELREKGFLDF